MEGPPLGPGGEDITWPDQVAPRGRKASSTRKIKPQTSNLRLRWAGIVLIRDPVAPAAPIFLAYLALFSLSQWITFLKVTFADGRPMWVSLGSPAGPAGIRVRGSSGLEVHFLKVTRVISLAPP